MWKGGRFSLDPVDPVDPVDPARVLKYGFVRSCPQKVGLREVRSAGSRTILQKKNKISPLQACSSFVFKQHQIDGVVVGCDSKEQLDQILRSVRMKSDFSAPNLNIKNRKLLEPRQWIN